MIFKGTIIGAASGKLAGNVFSHNKGGQYIRQFVVPTNPNTLPQNRVRLFMADLSARWGNALTQAQRDGWIDYAANVPQINALGDEIFVTGLNQYVRANVPRIQASLPRQDDAPVIFDRGGFTAPTFGIDAGTDEVDVSFEVTDDWVNEDGAAMLVYVSRPVGVAIEYFTGPYQFAGSIPGDATTPPTSPAAIAIPFNYTAGQKGFVRVTVTREDGRLATPFRDSAIAA
jgi:hypothetical protein